jgi:pristinamycin I synthase-3/4
LQDLGRREGVTQYMLLLAAFQVLLSRWSGQKDIVVGTPIAGRTYRETEGLIGFFLNTLVMRTDLSVDPPFVELLGQVREATLGAYAHQDIPFEKLVEELHPVRDLGRQPLFQVLFALQNLPPESFELPGLRLQPVGGTHVMAKFDLSLYLQETPSGLRGAFQYATDLFDRETIERLAGHFETLLGGIVADPGRRTGDLPLLNAAERHRLLVEWNATQADYPHEHCLHELFAQQAARTPDAVAVVYEDRELSYAELERRSNQLGRHLRALGVGPDVTVGVCVERSPELVIGLLGILKAGGAYLPLDPEYPPERLAFMLEDANAPVVVTQSAWVTRLSEPPATVVCLDRDRERIADYSASASASGACPENLAYVIYTSGSTGKPKGVAVRHQAVANYLHFLRKQLGLGHDDTVLQVSAISFDPSVRDIFGPLLHGSRLVIMSADARKDPRAYLENIERHGISTLLSIIPRLLDSVVSAAGDSVAGESLRDVLTCGEPLNYATHDAFRRTIRNSRLVNQYGPTECTMVSAWFVADEGSNRCGSVPIGRPISNARLYVLDEELAPAPIGVAGELYIGGTGLARGYLHRPGLTAERFIANPYGEGERLYRTGDLVRYRPEGNLEFIGRVDGQVKIRGFRIETGEVEAMLLSFGGVSQAVVVSREYEPGERRLLGYVVGDREAIDVAALRTHLERSLPQYMVPSALMVLDALPLTPNGKIDRQSLPAPAGRPELVTYVEPRTEVEAGLASIWCEVLGLDRVGAEDDFFAMGGHSLLATRVIARVRDLFGVEVALRELFSTPTLRALAQRIEGLRWAAGNRQVLLSNGGEKQAVEGTV